MLVGKKRQLRDQRPTAWKLSACKQTHQRVQAVAVTRGNHDASPTSVVLRHGGFWYLSENGVWPLSGDATSLGRSESFLAGCSCVCVPPCPTARWLLSGDGTSRNKRGKRLSGEQVPCMHGRGGPLDKRKQKDRRTEGQKDRRTAGQEVLGRRRERGCSCVSCWLALFLVLAETGD